MEIYLLTSYRPLQYQSKVTLSKVKVYDAEILEEKGIAASGMCGHLCADISEKRVKIFRTVQAYSFKYEDPECEDVVVEKEFPRAFCNAANMVKFGDYWVVFYNGESKLPDVLKEDMETVVMTLSRYLKVIDWHQPGLSSSKISVTSRWVSIFNNDLYYLTTKDELIMLRMEDIAAKKQQLRVVATNIQDFAFDSSRLTLLDNDGRISIGNDIWFKIDEKIPLAKNTVWTLLQCFSNRGDFLVSAWGDTKLKNYYFHVNVRKRAVLSHLEQEMDVSLDRWYSSPVEFARPFRIQDTQFFFAVRKTFTGDVLALNSRRKLQFVATKIQLSDNPVAGIGSVVQIWPQRKVKRCQFGGPTASKSEKVQFIFAGSGWLKRLSISYN